MQNYRTQIIFLSASAPNTEQVDMQALREEDAKKEACEWCWSWHTK